MGNACLGWVREIESSKGEEGRKKWVHYYLFEIYTDIPHILPIYVKYPQCYGISILLQVLKWVFFNFSFSKALSLIFIFFSD